MRHVRKRVAYDVAGNAEFVWKVSEYWLNFESYRFVFALRCKC